MNNQSIDYFKSGMSLGWMAYNILWSSEVKIFNLIIALVCFATGLPEAGTVLIISVPAILFLNLLMWAYNLDPSELISGTQDKRTN